MPPETMTFTSCVSKKKSCKINITPATNFTAAHFNLLLITRHWYTVVFFQREVQC